MAWNPQQYLKFGGERLQPAHDLLARVALDEPKHIVDLGCGTGTVTSLLRTRWPDAQIVGVDNSRPMLEQARNVMPDVTFELTDVAKWTPAAPVDLIVSNAALQWLDDHARLFPQLFSHLRRGGVLAVQMPAQHMAPSHQIGYSIAESPRWRNLLQGLVRRRPILDAHEYYSLMRRRATRLDLWFTEYVQQLTGDNPVVEFAKGSFVGAWLSALSADEAPAFEAEYRQNIAIAYPPGTDGVTLFPFRRFFLIAQR